MIILCLLLTSVLYYGKYQLICLLMWINIDVLLVFFNLDRAFSPAKACDGSITMKLCKIVITVIEHLGTVIEHLGNLKALP